MWERYLIFENPIFSFALIGFIHQIKVAMMQFGLYVD
jgi:hypothetical protein